MKSELARVRPGDCDRRVLAALLPRAKHLGAPARRLAHAAQIVGGRASLRRVRQRLRRVTREAAR